MFFRDPEPDPSAHVREKPVRDRRGRLALVRLTPAQRQSEEQPLLQVHKGPALASVRRGRRNRACPRARVGADQNEAGEMPQGALLRPDRSVAPGLFFAGAPARPYEPRRLLARQPTVARPTPLRQDDGHMAAMKALLRVMIDRGPQILQVAPGPAGAPALLDVGATGCGRDLGQHLAAEELREANDAAFDLLRVAGLGGPA